jgi:hypothetical protein
MSKNTTIPMLTREALALLGFKDVQDIIMRSMCYDIGRDRNISIGCIGEPNEMMFLVYRDSEDPRKAEVITLWNYDYDGYLSIEKVQQLLTFFTI